MGQIRARGGPDQGGGSGGPEDGTGLKYSSGGGEGCVRALNGNGKSTIKIQCF